MTLSEELRWRGFYNQTTFASPSVLDTTKYTLYLGIDPSADSLHVGHLAMCLMVRRFLEHGHTVFLLIGGGTGMIGDMRDTEERELKPLHEIEHNTKALAAQVSRLFSNQPFELVDNYDWLSGTKLLPFLRDIGKSFSMNELTSRDYYKSRTGSNSTGGLSYAEFSYTILQGYDYLHLHREKGVNLQIGGSDQWGNLLSGVELIRKKTGDVVHALSSPLVINRSTGRKFGKSEAGAVWLDPTKTTPYQFYQFWLNIDDASVIDYLKLFTLLDQPAIDELDRKQAVEPGQREAQRALAFEVTKLVHGETRAEQARNVTAVLFTDTPLEKLGDEEIHMLSHEILTVTPDTLVNILVVGSVASSNGEAKRLISGGAIRVNGKKVTEDIQIQPPSLIKKGKNTFILVR